MKSITQSTDVENEFSTTVEALRRFSARTGENLGAANRRLHFQRVGMRHGGNGKCNVFQNLDEDPAQPEHDGRAERRIVDRAEDDFRSEIFFQALPSAAPECAA